MKIVDLHSHTTASDGSLTPTQLVDYAKEQGLAALAITDHDTTGGLDEALARAKEIGLEVIPGIEIATVVEGCDVHIVGLFIDHHHPQMTAHVAKMAQTRVDRNFAMIDKLKAAGINIDRSDLDRFEGSSIARGHIAAILIERGYATDLKDAMAKYMLTGTVGYVKRENPPPGECVEVIHQGGGLAFIAHINQIDRQDWAHGEAVVRQVMAAGADGIETLYSEYDQTWQERAEALVQEFGALRSGGSDYHGAIKKNLELATGYGALAVPYDYVEAMKARLAEKMK